MYEIVEPIASVIKNDFSESRQRLISYLKNKYTINDSNSFNLEVIKSLQSVFNPKENSDYHLLIACAVSGDTKLLLAFMKLIALAYIPAAKDAIMTGSVTFHEADGDNSKKDWLEFKASNIYRSTLKLIYQTLLTANCFRFKTYETSIPFLNCSINAITTIEKLTEQFTTLLNKIPADNVIDELLLSVDNTYLPSNSPGENDINFGHPQYSSERKQS